MNVNAEDVIFITDKESKTLPEFVAYVVAYIKSINDSVDDIENRLEDLERKINKPH
jgi:hypothetical protein